MSTPRRPRAAYHAYLLRLWCEDDGQPWRASLQSATTKQTHHFPHIDALLTFLLQQMDAPPAPAHGSTRADAHED